MKRTLITLIAAGTLAVPAGLALAQDDTPQPTEPTPTCEEHEHSRDRVNQHDPAAEHGQHRAENRYQVEGAPCDGDCPGPMAHERNQVRVEDGTGEQVRNQVRLEDGTCDGDCADEQVQNRHQVQLEDNAGDGTCDGDCTGDRVRDQVRLEDETGDQVQLRTPTRIADQTNNGRRLGNG